jgi:hypothetical protein
MKALRWVRLVIVLVLGVSGMLIPGGSSAQDNREMSAFSFEKYYCSAIDEQAAERTARCIGRLDETIGTDVTFILTDLTTGTEQFITVVIEDFEDQTVGFADVGAPEGPYELCEIVTEGYDAWLPDQSGATVEGACYTFELEVIDPPDASLSFSFYNTPVDVGELPDTGSGKVTSRRDGSLPAVLLSGALLMLVARVRLRPSHAR